VALLAAVVGLAVPPRHWLATGVVASAGIGVAVLARRARQRRVVGLRRCEAQGFCEDLAAELAAGLPAGRSLDSATARRPGYERVAAAHRLGGSVPDALRELAGDPGAEDLRLVAAAWQVGQHSGAGLAVTLAGVAGSIRERQSTRRVVESELASARATARLVAGLPLLTLALGSGAGGNPYAFLLLSPLGLACLAGGLALGFAGLAWIEAIAAGVEGPGP
jgi:tight adherence protein B